MQEQIVILVHGLWMNAFALYPLQTRVGRCGFRVERFSYATVGTGLEENARRLGRGIEHAQAAAIHLVGHSLGGVVALHAIALRADPRVRRIVLMGSPVAGSAAGRSLARTCPGRWMLGRSETAWSERPSPSAPPGVEVGIIAGRLPLGLGRLLARLPSPNDGVVTVEETRVQGAKDSVLLPLNHTGLLFSARAARQVCAFLRDGRFLED
ncbi:MAG TPA: alpha/beta fold hydrolase [Burkholderiales bacterium]|nr:alpha/beta fold hydrolase [Burkholderiales bacterium]